MSPTAAENTHHLSLTENDLERHEVCPVCQGSRSSFFRRTYYLRKPISFDICLDCNLVYMNPHPSQNWYDQLYQNEFWEVKSHRQSGSSVHRNVKMWMKAYGRVDKYIDFLVNNDVQIPMGGRILEIGSAYGLIVSEMAQRFKCQAFGVEPNHAARAFATDYAGLESVAENMKGLAKWSGTNSVDLVIFSHVLENVVDLDDTFQTLCRMLKPGSLILIETPNIYFPRGTHIYHPYCFCSRSLSRLLARYGFEVVRGQVTGRPSTVLSPKYLTILGRKTDKPSLILEDSSTPILAKLRMQLGFFWYSLAARLPLKGLDKIISARYYRLNPSLRQALRELEVSVKQAGK